MRKTKSKTRAVTKRAAPRAKPKAPTTKSPPKRAFLSALDAFAEYGREVKRIAEERVSVVDGFVPSGPADLVDAYYLLRSTRYLLQNASESISKRESVLRAAILQAIAADGSRGVVGERGRAEIVDRRRVEVLNWDALLDHVRRSKEFELLQRRVSEAAIIERVDNGVSVPGCDVVPFPDLSVKGA